MYLLNQNPVVNVIGFISTIKKKNSIYLVVGLSIQIN